MSVWKPHDPQRPRPRSVDPRSRDAPPSDAVVLFNGATLDEWESVDGGSAPWLIEDGALTVVPESGNIRTRRAFSDCQLHIEWATPAEPSGSGQERGNSGVFLMGLYEIQILDSYENETYADGYVGAVYGQHPPLVNASRAAGEWQSFDVAFSAPRFDESGALLHAAFITLLHNGVLVHHHVALMGPTASGRRPPYRPHARRLPIVLQEHGSPVRFRNIWLRDLAAD